jgi:RND family efflux transporter MFP subunit
MARVDFRRPRVWLPALIGLTLVGVVIFRVVQAASPAEPLPSVEELRDANGIPVSVVEAIGGRLELWRQHSGTVAGRREGVVRARSDDPVAAVLVSVGERVREGQVLVRMSSEGAEARQRQAAAAEAQARRVLERMRPLHAAGAISDQEWDQVETQHALARADLAAAGAPLELTSPLSGTVTEVTAQPGLVARSGEGLVRVADLSELHVFLHLSGADVEGLRTGLPARVGAGATGRVHRVALQADPATRLVEVVVAFPPSAGLIAGTMATIEVRTAEREDVVQVPRTAVRDGIAWVVGADDRVARRTVSLGLQGTDVVEVLHGIQAGERVVVEGAALLSDGARVRVVAGREG